MLPPEPAAKSAAPSRRCMELRACGYPELHVDGRPVALKLKRGLALLVYLSELGGKAARAQLAELLWPDAAAELGRARLRRLCHEVNTTLALELLAGDGDAVWLAGGEGTLRSDVARLHAIARRVLRTSAGDAAPSDDMAPALDALCAPQAAGLLDGFELPSDSFMAWRDSRRAEHQQLLVRALSVAAAQCQARGEAERAELGIRPSAQIEAAYERAHQRLAPAPASRLRRPTRPRRCTSPTATAARWPTCVWAMPRRAAAR